MAINKPVTKHAAGPRLEVFNARYGDALLLHYDAPKGPGLVVIDGGPDGTYEKVMRARLEALRDGAGPLAVRLLVVTHIDRDHITGVLELARDADERAKAQKDNPYRVASFWHNSFDDLVGTGQPLPPPANQPAAASLPGSLVDLDAYLGHGEPVEASVQQGVELREIAGRLVWERREFADSELVCLPAKGDEASCDLGGLTLTVLGPSRSRLDKLREEWKKALAKNDRKAAAALISDAKEDNSVTNLSSIAVLAEAGGRRMLLTGDALGRHVIEGLKATGLLADPGTIKVDLLKLPHHGSDRNNNLEFFRCIQADHYVVSADGRYGNPDLNAFRALLESRRDDDFTVHVTNDRDDNGKSLTAVDFLLQQQKAGRKFTLHVRPVGDPSFVIDFSAGSAPSPAPSPRPRGLKPTPKPAAGAGPKGRKAPPKKN